MSRNTFGLARSIPEPIKRAVRQRCGFGCVLCGCAIVQYHHFDPPFADAHIHDPDGITLLCGLCHDRENRGVLTAQQVARANASPYCKSIGHTGDILFVGRADLPVRFGSSRIHAPTVLMYDQQVVLGVSPGADANGPALLNANFADGNGKSLLRINNNEWRVRAGHYDVRTTASTLIINSAARNIVLQMSLTTDTELAIDQLTMNHRGFAINVDTSGFSVTTPRGSTFRHTGSNFADIGIWMKSSGRALISASTAGGAAISL